MADESNQLVTFWLTRDVGADGVLSDMVDVWLEAPTMHRLPGGGSMWLGPGTTGLEKRYAQWTLDVARGHCTIPETGRESVRKY